MGNAIAILIAALGAVIMSIGTQMQSSGVAKTDKSIDEQAGTGGFSLRELLNLFRSKRWVIGTLLLGLSVVVQVTALSMAPIMVVQPIGIIALVLTTYLNAHLANLHIGRSVLTGVAMCMVGIGLFVIMAATIAVDHPVTDRRLIEVLLLLACVLVVFAIGFALFGRRIRAVVYIIGAGVLFAFVSTLAKLLVARVRDGNFEWLTLVTALALAVTAALGSWFVQNAHASGPPDLVMAGLTVIDPLVAVLIGMIVLEEATKAPLWMLAAFVITGAIGVGGVFVIARHHPQVRGLKRAEDRLKISPPPHS